MKKARAIIAKAVFKLPTWPCSAPLTDGPFWCVCRVSCDGRLSFAEWHLGVACVHKTRHGAIQSYLPLSHDLRVAIVKLPKVPKHVNICE
jgi:hypothetical protein